MVELVLVLALIVLLTSLAVPVTAHSVDAAARAHAAGFVASRFRLARQHAAFQMTTVGIVFDTTAAGRWTLRVCRDGNGNGLRRAEIAGGRDVCPEGPYDLTHMFPGIDILVDPGLPGPDGEPGSPDAVRFGRSNIASFAPEGSGTAGTLFLRSARGDQYAVRVGNITGRTRILRYDPARRQWSGR